MSIRSLRRLARRSAGTVGPVESLYLPGTSSNYASTPDSVANNLEWSDIDLRVKVKMDDWTPAADSTLIDKFSVLQQSYQFYVMPDGTLQFNISTTGSDTIGVPSSIPTGFTDGTVHWVRVIRARGGGLRTFYISEDGSNWTALGTNAVFSAGTPMFNGTAPVTVGAQSGGGAALAGEIHHVEIKNGIGGLIVATFAPTGVTKLGTRNPSSIVASTGETWTLTGSTWDWLT